MTIQLFPRREREPFEVPAPSGKVSVPAPVAVKRRVPKNMWQIIGVFIMLFGLGGVMYVLYTAGMLRYGVFPLLMVVTYGVMFIRQGGGKNKQPWGEGEADRIDWFNEADIARRQLDDAAEKQYLRAWRCHPDPRNLVKEVGGGGMWERRPVQPADGLRDFGHVRLGLGTVRQAMQVEAAPLPDKVVWIEPASGHGSKKFLKEKRYVPGMPRVVALAETKALSLVGPLDAVRELASAVVCQLSAWHSPEDLKIMVVTARPELWEWVKWLPHSLDPGRRDGCGARRMVFTSPAQYENYHAAEIRDRGKWTKPSTGPGSQGRAAGQSGGPAQSRPLWIVIDDACGTEIDWATAAPNPGLGSACFIRLAESVGKGLGFSRDSVYQLSLETNPAGDERRVVRKLDPSQPAVPTLQGEKQELAFYADADALTVSEAERFARLMGQYQPGNEGEAETGHELALGRTLLDVVGVRDARVLDTERLWADRWHRSRKLWSFPIGIDDEGRVIEMDLKESSEFGWNLHGVIVGHFGSGKSVAIAAIVEGQLVTHSPERAVVALFDLKSKSIAQKLEKLPNVIAAVSNLRDERHLIKRMHIALAGLFERRKEAVTAAECIDIIQYDAKIAAGADLPIIPLLQIIVDEFNELPNVYPEIFPFFDHIVRQARAYGVALLLSGQKYDMRILKDIHELWGYKICLRTGTAETSRNVIGEPIAYHLPSAGAEGTCFIRVGSDPLRKGRFFNATAPFVPPPEEDEAPVIESGVWFEPREFTATEAEDPDGKMNPPPIEIKRAAPVQVEQRPVGEVALTEVEVVGLAAGGVAARPVVDFWLPPLDEGKDIDELVQMLRGKPWDDDYGNNPGLLLPIAQEDRPYDYQQPVLSLDLSKQHYTVVGRSKMGVTSALRTAVLGGALMYRPDRVQFYCLAGGGSPLMSLRKVPHVQAVIGVDDTDGIARVLESILDIMAARRQQFEALDISSEDFFRRRAIDPTDLPEIEGGEIVLVIDGYVNLKEAMFHPREDRFMKKVESIARSGLGSGVHVVVANDTCGHEFHLNLQKACAGKYELKLSEPNESKINRVDQNDLKARPGVGLSMERYTAMTAVPRLKDAGGVVVDTTEGYEKVFGAVAGAQRSTQMNRLPAAITLQDLQKQAPGEVVFALEEKTMAPMRWNFKRTPHLVLLGGPHSGRTNGLRTACQAITSVLTPEEAVFHFLDLRRDLVGVVDPAYIKSFAVSAPDARAAMIDLVARLQLRKPPKGMDPVAAAMGRHWSGPEHFVVVDNVELFPHQNAAEFPFGPVSFEPGADSVAALATQGAQLGLHFLVSSQLDTWFPSMQMQNVLLRNLKNMFSPTVVLNGDPSLPAIAGQGVRPQLQRPGKGLWAEATTNAPNVLFAWTEPPNLDDLKTGVTGPQ